jgi:hypothetical protein
LTPADIAGRWWIALAGRRLHRRCSTYLEMSFGTKWSSSSDEAPDSCALNNGHQQRLFPVLQPTPEPRLAPARPPRVHADIRQSRFPTAEIGGSHATRAVTRPSDTENERQSTTTVGRRFCRSGARSTCGLALRSHTLVTSGIRTPPASSASRPAPCPSRARTPGRARYLPATPRSADEPLTREHGAHWSGTRASTDLPSW